MVKVNVKWGKQRFEVELDPSESVTVFKTQLWTITSVPPERQKILGLKGLKGDDTDLSTLTIKEGQTVMLMGSAEEVKKPEKATVFIEDLKEGEVQDLSLYPSGLENLGNTCYLNSVVHFMREVPELKDAVQNYTGGDTVQPRDHQLTTQMSSLFKQLNKTGAPVTPLAFVTTFRQVFPQFAQMSQQGGYSQQDAHDCYVQLLGTLKNALPTKDSDGKRKNVVADLFEGEMEVTLKCAEGDEAPAIKKESYQYLPCFIGNTTNHLHEGLTRGLGEEVITKRSEALGRDADYKQTKVLTKLPKYLAINFVRFFWRQDTQKRAKILRSVKFPLDLDVSGFCKEDLKTQFSETRAKLLEFTDALRKYETDKVTHEEKAKMAATTDDGDAVMSDAEAVPELGPAPTLDPEVLAAETGQYELCAVVTHAGRVADGGHYVCYAKSEKKINSTDKGQWLRFDDDTVTAVGEEDVKNLAGGGDWHMAYMCLYRQKQSEVPGAKK